MLFAGTVRENVATGRAAASAEESVLCTVATAMLAHERDSGNSLSACACSWAHCVCEHHHQQASVLITEQDSETQETKIGEGDLENPAPPAGKNCTFPIHIVGF